MPKCAVDLIAGLARRSVYRSSSVRISLQSKLSAALALAFLALALEPKHWCPVESDSNKMQMSKSVYAAVTTFEAPC
jgi:hypothetical protein